MSRNCHSGFTLVELLLSIGMISVIAGIGIPVFARTLTKNDLDVATEDWVFALRRASILSQSVANDSRWGVKAFSGVVVVFQGDSYATRNAAFDEITTEPVTISFSGVSEVVMGKLTGYPNVSGVLTLSNATDNKSVTINSKGMVSY